MIESYYWKQDLLLAARRLLSRKKPARWTERLVVNFEKEVTICFFMVRYLLERERISNKTKRMQFRLFAHSPISREINNRNYMHVDELYDLATEQIVTKNIEFISNQFIHAGAIFAHRSKDRYWDYFYLCSDFERKRAIYRIPIPTIAEIFETVAQDYPRGMSLVYDERRNDYFWEENQAADTTEEKPSLN